MIIGIDMGASAVKLAALEGDEVVLTHYEHGRRADVPALCEKLGLDLAAAEAVVLTGLSARKSGLERLGIKTLTVPEAEAIGRGGTWLSGRDNIVVASMGTGTAFVQPRRAASSRTCAARAWARARSRGSRRRYSACAACAQFDALAMTGDTNRVDLTIGDFVEQHGDLTPPTSQPATSRAAIPTPARTTGRRA